MGDFVNSASCGALLLWLLPDVFNEFSGGHSHYFLEIPVCCGALAVAYIVEKFVKVGVRFFFQGLYHIAYAAVRDILHKGHSSVVLERFAHVCAVRLQLFGK